MITGAGRGLGAAIAERFHDEGALALINDLDPSTAEAQAERVGAKAYPADVSDSEAVTAMVEWVKRDHGRLDILVNNAGISGLEGEDPELVQERQEISLRQIEEIQAGGPVTSHHNRTAEMTDREWRRMIAVHLDGTFYCCRAALPMMAAQSSGSIINLGSIMGTAGGAGSSHYCAAKAGILGFTRSLAREVVTRGIRVNAIAPGWIATDMTDPLDLLRSVIEAQTPMGHFGEPDDIAWAAVYLASDESKFVTGQVLSPNGGWHMSQ